MTGKMRPGSRPTPCLQKGAEGEGWLWRTEQSMAVEGPKCGPEVQQGMEEGPRCGVLRRSEERGCRRGTRPLALVLLFLGLGSGWMWQQSGSAGSTAAGTREDGVSMNSNKDFVPSDEPAGLLPLRRKRYAINPLGHKWDHLNLTYTIVQYPSTLNREDTDKAIAIAFKMWSNASPLTFRRVLTAEESDLKIGFYTFNHTDCWFSPLHPCFDGLNGELAHAFLPPRGDIHFDNHEYWILGRSRFSWKQGVWYNDLVQVAAHEIGHALGLWHSRDTRALMHPNATYTRTRHITQDDIWGIQRLYGCLDRKRQCGSWAQLGFCTSRRLFMKKHCVKTCDFCSDAVEAQTSLSSSKIKVETRYVPKGRSVTFRCGLVSSGRLLRVSWYKDGELLTESVPGNLTLRSRDLIIIATEGNEGRYTCLIRRQTVVLKANAWEIRLQPDKTD
ncbi:matrix metalloproteinase-23-like [Ambystoma mexicanum]|uniref:matrix metalloproteinase-23-like n=1 Tax=Ambystoma mexicanum TaxID=8296 RepID=UPI0037E804A1